MQVTTTTPPNEKKIPESKIEPEEGLPPAHEIAHEPEKEEVEEEVKESFKDEDVPVEPVVGNDGEEVGGEG